MRPSIHSCGLLNSIIGIDDTKLLERLIIHDFILFKILFLDTEDEVTKLPEECSL